MNLKKFKYTAMNVERKRFTGVFFAENNDHLQKQLAGQGLYLIKAKEVKATTVNTFFSLTGKVKAGELAAFCQQFAIMVKTGIPIVSVLDSLRKQPYSGLLKKTLDFVYEDVKGGVLLSAAMGKHRQVFPRFFCSMIYVGEVGSSLDKILATLADYLESDARIRKKTMNAMIYPLILTIMAIGIIVLMVTFIIPTFIDALGSMDVEMPSITLAINNFGIWVGNHWKIIIVAMILVIVFCILFVHTKKGKYCWHMVLFRAPILRKINSSHITARFAHSFGLLIEGGSDVIDALETVQIVLDNLYVEAKMKAAINEVKQGKSVAVALGNHKVFPTLLLQMIAVGEQTGNLAEPIARVCPFFDNEAEDSIGRITSVLQPIVLAVIGATVAVLFYAIYSPLLQIMTTMGG